MRAHSTLLVIGLALVPLLFGGALLDDSLGGALVTLIGAWIFSAVLATAWIRPASGSPEHHPRIDRLFDDTSP